MFSIAHSRLIDMCRATARMDKLVVVAALSRGDSNVVENCPGGRDPAEIAEQRDSLAAAESVLESIPRVQADALRGYAQGDSCMEMARQFGTNKGTITSRMFHGRQNLYDGLFVNAVKACVRQCVEA